MRPVVLNPNCPPVSSSSEIASVIVNATNGQIAEKSLPDEEAVADLRISTDALNYHRVEWRLREELGEVLPSLLANVRPKICENRSFEPEEFDAALVATKDRPRLPYGWTAMDLAQRKLACTADPHPSSPAPLE